MRFRSSTVFPFGFECVHKRCLNAGKKWVVSCLAHAVVASPARKKYASHPVKQSKQWVASQLWSSIRTLSHKKNKVYKRTTVRFTRNWRCRHVRASQNFLFWDPFQKSYFCATPLVDSLDQWFLTGCRLQYSGLPRANTFFQYIIKKYIFKLSSNLKASYYEFATGLFLFCSVAQACKVWEPVA